MPLSVDLKTDLGNAATWSAQFAKQLPFATAGALNDTAFDARGNALPGATRQYFDRPTPFIQKGWRVDRANKNNLEVTIGAENQRVRVIRRQVQGGPRVLKPFEARFGIGYLVPGAAAKLNQYGNISRANITKIGGGIGNNFFIAEPGNPQGIGPGIYQRTKGGIKPFLISASRPSYSPRFPIGEVVMKVYERRYMRFLISSLERALATAR